MFTIAIIETLDPAEGLSYWKCVQILSDEMRSNPQNVLLQKRRSSEYRMPLNRPLKVFVIVSTLISGH